MPLTTVRSFFRAQWPLLAILVLYLALAFYRIGVQDFDADALATSATMRLPVRGIIANRLAQGHSPTYFLVEKAWIALWGHTPTVLLIVPIALGALAIPAARLLGQSLGLGRWSWMAAAIVAVHPTTIELARWIRPYSGVIPIATLSLAASVRALRRPTPAASAALAATGILSALWNFSLFPLWLGILAGFLIVGEIRRTAPLRLWLALAVALGVQGAMGVALSFITGGARRLDWIEPQSPLDTANVLFKFLSAGSAWIKRPEWTWLLPLTLGGCYAWSAWQAWRSPEAGALWACRKLVLLAAALPIGLMILISLTVRPVLVERYLAPYLIVFAVSTASLSADLGRRARAPAVALAVVVMVLAIQTDRRMIREQGNGLRECIALLEANCKPGDVVMCFNKPSVEALRLFSGKDYDVFSVWPGLGAEAGWRTFDQETAGHGRLWALGYQREGGLMSTARWSDLYKRGKFFKKEIGLTKLVGIDLVR